MEDQPIRLREFRVERLNGKISREKYWIEISRVLRDFQELFDIRSNKVKSIEIGQEFTLTYEVALSKQIKMIIDPNDLRTAPMSIISEGNYEEFECFMLLRIAEVSELFCDIGANIGFYTLACSVVNPKLRILSFEPNQVVVGNLKRNLEINSPEICTTNVSVFPIALGESKTESAEFYVPKFSGSGAGSLKNLHPDEGDAKSFKTDIDSLDSILRKETMLDLIKMDVEGFELSVLKGSMNSIEEFKPTIFIELLRKWMKPFGNHPQDVIELLLPLGYTCFAIGVNNLTEILEIDENTVENNFIFVHRQRSEHFKIITEGK